MLTLIRDHVPDTTNLLDLRALEYVLANTTAELFASSLPGETRSERSARRAAAGDIVEDLLAQARTAARTVPPPAAPIGAAA